jgi:hypothetical protein
LSGFHRNCGAIMAPLAGKSDPFLNFSSVRCDNVTCKLKSKRVTAGHTVVIRGSLMALASSPDAASQELSEGAPKVFRQRNSQRFKQRIQS